MPGDSREPENGAKRHRRRDLIWIGGTPPLLGNRWAQKELHL